jgi:hypothetical protein
VRQATPKVYRPPYWKVSLVLSILILIAGLLLLIYDLMRYPELDLISFIGHLGLILLYVGFLGIPLLLDALQKRILIFPDRLEYYAITYHIRVTWSDIEKVTRPKRPWWLRMRGHGQIVEWLVLRRALLTGSPWAKAWLRFSGYGQLIPITDFGLDWQESELGNDIRRYAPQLDI